MLYRCWALLIGLVIVSLLGCGDAAQSVITYPAKGVVVYKDGQPYTGRGVIVFAPAEGDGAVAKGDIDKDGRFALRTKATPEGPPDGAPEGKFKVYLDVTMIKPETSTLPKSGAGGAPPPTGGPSTKPPKPQIAAIYTDPKQTPISVDVSRDAAKNDFKIEVTK
jgi:hypothetical protein